MLNACVAVFKCRPVRFHCVILFWSSIIIECLLFTFENRVPIMREGGVSGVASFITTDEQLQKKRGCCFPMQAVFPEKFPFTSFLGRLQDPVS